MTIKTQAYLQGYMHEKTAGWRGRRETPIVKAPGIPQTAPDPKVKLLFPGGKARFEATQVQMPPTTPDAQGRGVRRPWESLTPASVNNQLLTRLPGGPDAFVAEQRFNYERDRGRQRNLKPMVRPSKDLIDFDKRNQPVSLDTDDTSWGRPATYIEERRIVGLDPEELRKHPEGRWLSSVQRQGESQQFRDYTGYPETSDGRSAGRPSESMPVLMHELTHNYTGGREPGDYVAGPVKFPVGTSYITDKGLEYTQAATSGLNAMRDVTGEYLNDPQQVHQLFDEIIAKPSILNSIASEHARVFRTYLTLRETNPELAKQLRDSMARDSQYLVKNERVEDPMVKIPRSWV